MNLFTKARELYNDALDATIGKLDPFINEKQVETDPDKHWRENDGVLDDDAIPGLLPVALVFSIAFTIAIVLIIISQGV